MLPKLKFSRQQNWTFESLNLTCDSEILVDTTRMSLLLKDCLQKHLKTITTKKDLIKFIFKMSSTEFGFC
jgi:hypothetical protein